MEKIEYPFSWYGTKVSGGPIVGQREKERREAGIPPTLPELVDQLVRSMTPKKDKL